MAIPMHFVLRLESNNKNTYDNIPTTNDNTILDNLLDIFVTIKLYTYNLTLYNKSISVANNQR